ncbi:Membrane dipeptidase (Peptidase family M19) [Novipirellula galeiformis]|uniref:Membrane dipeptidase (Peptidase family M19) n=1 Tax=Novipirellula galeiformis TaxID=2528004 RepID=A0A5C6BHY2_9BACT|nr:membrane dipeptidase [Novipirellula galeiformis]TWU11151.1 Membrane dipeptidase (Peptidase family M19) [Novipirellula galeiformis]
MLLFDAHLDLALNGVDLNRDFRQAVDDIRVQERVAGMDGILGRCKNTLSFPELRDAGVAVCLTTLLARLEPNVGHDFGHITAEACYAYAHAHLAYYRAMERSGWMRMIKTKSELREHWQKYSAQPDSEPLGFILAMEGADPLLTPGTIDEFYEHGLRAIGLTHYGGNRYGGGTRSENGLALDAVDLLSHIERLGMTVDMTHLSDKSFWQVAERFGGRIHASHQNSRRISNWQRQFSDDQYRLVIQRGGVIGIAFDAIMMQHGYTQGKSEPVATIDAAIENIDIVCQLAGNADHVGIGTDLDGGFGYEQTPTDLNRYTDLPPALLAGMSDRGYSQADIEKIMHGNWMRFFGEILPE